MPRLTSLQMQRRMRQMYAHTRFFRCFWANTNRATTHLAARIRNSQLSARAVNRRGELTEGFEPLRPEIIRAPTRLYQAAARACSTEILPDLFCAEGADAVEAEAEDDAVLAAEADVVAEVLHGHVAAIPSVAKRPDGTDERVVFARSVLEIEEEGRAAKEAVPDVAEKDRRTPLRTFECARLSAARVGELLQARRGAQGARVIEGLERLHEWAADAKARGEVAQARALHIEVCAHVEEEFVARAIARNLATSFGI